MLLPGQLQLESTVVVINGIPSKARVPAWRSIIKPWFIRWFRLAVGLVKGLVFSMKSWPPIRIVSDILIGHLGQPFAGLGKWMQSSKAPLTVKWHQWESNHPTQCFRKKWSSLVIAGLIKGQWLMIPLQVSCLSTVVGRDSVPRSIKAWFTSHRCRLVQSPTEGIPTMTSTSWSTTSTSGKPQVNYPVTMLERPCKQDQRDISVEATHLLVYNLGKKYELEAYPTHGAQTPIKAVNLW